MTTFTSRHTFDIDIDTYWDKVFFDEEYNKQLFVDELQFGAYEVLELNRKPDGSVTRKVRTEPKSDAPAVVKKLVGDSLSYVESGEFDPKARRWKYSVVTSKLSDKVKIGGEFWVEPRPDGKIDRCVTCTIEVKIFGVGGAVEGFIEKQTKESYDKAAAFTNKWIREKGLSK